MKTGKYKLASSKRWTERESSNFSASYLKIPKDMEIYQLKTGKAKLDVIPFVAGKGNPNADPGLLWWERTIFVHKNVGPNGSTYICPARTANKPCPICEDRARIMKGDPDEEDMKQAKGLNAKEVQIIQLRDRNNKEKGIQLLPLSFYRFGEAILDGAAAGEEGDGWGDFWHPSGGHTLRVHWAEDSMGSAKFVRAKTVMFEKREQDLPDSLIAKGHCLDDLLIILDYKKLKSIYESGSEEPEDESDDEPKKKKKGKGKEREEEEDGDDDDDSEDSDDSDSEDEDSDSEDSDKESGADDDDDSEEGDEEDDGDEDEDEPKSKSKKSKSSKSKKSKKKVEDDDDDGDEDSDSEEDGDDEDADEESDDSDDGDESDDDDSDDDSDEDEDGDSDSDEEDSEDEEESEDEDAESEDDDSEETPKGGKFRTATDKDMKRAKKSADARKKGKKDPDWDKFDAPDDEEDEESEPAPKKNKKKK
jgi:hypothetical protein